MRADVRVSGRSLLLRLAAHFDPHSLSLSLSLSRIFLLKMHHNASETPVPPSPVLFPFQSFVESRLLHSSLLHSASFVLLVVFVVVVVVFFFLKCKQLLSSCASLRDWEEGESRALGSDRPADFLGYVSPPQQPPSRRHDLHQPRCRKLSGFAPAPF